MTLVLPSRSLVTLTAVVSTSFLWVGLRMNGEKLKTGSITSSFRHKQTESVSIDSSIKEKTKMKWDPESVFCFLLCCFKIRVTVPHLCADQAGPVERRELAMPERAALPEPV